MISKEYAAEFIIKNNMPHRLRARSLDFAETMHIDAEELDRAIDALSSAKTLTNITTSTLRDLREQQQKIERISSAPPLVILGFEEVRVDVTDLLLPITYDEKLNYIGLEASLLSYCKKAFGRDATLKICGYQGLVDINAPANSATAGETLDALAGLPSEFETARVYLDIIAHVHPGCAIASMSRQKTTTKERHMPGTEEREKHKRIAIDQAARNGGRITAGDLSKIEGITYQGAYFRLNSYKDAFHNDGGTFLLKS
ncbi:MAG: hypothetical protein AABX14_04100, partial [Candidatus Aenigmatarchaeota archaeon]